MYYINIMVYNFTVKEEILPFVTTQVDLEDITLSEMSDGKKDKTHMISLICKI